MKTGCIKIGYTKTGCITIGYKKTYYMKTGFTKKIKIGHTKAT